jgi:hypothetical protein
MITAFPNSRKVIFFVEEDKTRASGRWELKTRIGPGFLRPLPGPQQNIF